MLFFYFFFYCNIHHLCLAIMYAQQSLLLRTTLLPYTSITRNSKWPRGLSLKRERSVVWAHVYNNKSEITAPVANRLARKLYTIWRGEHIIEPLRDRIALFFFFFFIARLKHMTVKRRVSLGIISVCIGNIICPFRLREFRKKQKFRNRTYHPPTYAHNCTTGKKKK